MKIIDLNELRQRANALSRSEFETRLRQRIGALGRTLAHHVGNTVAARELRCLSGQQYRGYPDNTGVA